MDNATCQLCHQDMDGNSCTDTRPHPRTIGKIACRDWCMIEGSAPPPTH
jgi:hypothetical protein